MTEVIRDVIVFLLAMFVMFAVWVVTGGPERYASHVGPFIKAPPPLDSGEPYGFRYGQGKPPSDPNVTNSYYLPRPTYSPAVIAPSHPFEVRATGLRGAASAGVEYFTITNVSSEPKNITGFSVANESKTIATIGGGATLPYTGRQNTEAPIILEPGERAHVITGRSPAGVSFLVNKCSGYLSQFQSYTPPLATSCPLASDEIPASLRGTPCDDFAATIPRCSLVIDTRGTPADSAGQCRTFIERTIGYNACVDIHKNDNDFYQPTWYVFLGYDAPIWQKSGAVTILDAKKKVVGTSPF